MTWEFNFKDFLAAGAVQAMFRVEIEIRILGNNKMSEL